MLGRKLNLLERALIFIVSFVIVVYGMFRFRIWSTQMTNFFFRTDRWLELLFVFALTSFITTLLTWLLQLEFSIVAKTPIPKKKRRRTN